MNTPYYFMIHICDNIDIIYNLIFKLNIIFCSRNKLYHYFRLATIIIIIQNLNFVRNVKLYY